MIIIWCLASGIHLSCSQLVIQDITDMYHKQPVSCLFDHLAFHHVSESGDARAPVDLHSPQLRATTCVVQLQVQGLKQCQSYKRGHNTFTCTTFAFIPTLMEAPAPSHDSCMMWLRCNNELLALRYCCPTTFRTSCVAFEVDVGGVFAVASRVLHHIMYVSFALGTKHQPVQNLVRGLVQSVSLPQSSHPTPYILSLLKDQKICRSFERIHLQQIIIIIIIIKYAGCFRVSSAGMEKECSRRESGGDMGEYSSIDLVIEPDSSSKYQYR